MRTERIVLLVLLAAAIAWAVVSSTRVKTVRVEASQARRERDSLIRVMEARERTTSSRLAVVVDSLRAWHDSTLAAAITSNTYLGHHEEARALPLPDKWRYMGVVAVRVDSAAAGHP
jgi:hypothetical protein